MNILWSSNSPFVPTGYGSQTNTICRRLKQDGHKVGILCFFGLEGSTIDWEGIQLYPNNPRDYGIKHARMFYDDHQADIFLTLVDAWVLKGLDPKMNWVPWMPVDHSPVPPLVYEALKVSPGLVKPIAMSKFGYKSLAELGLEPFYVPHGVNTSLYKPSHKARVEFRQKMGWSDKFVIGTVGTNTAERKNWNASMRAVSIFNQRHPGEVAWYMHTKPQDPSGINLIGLRDLLDLKGKCFFPPEVQQEVGMEKADMVSAYNTMDVFLLPSKGEGFGIPIVEAQACGTPVIVCDNTAQTELCGGGWLVKKQIPTFTKQSSFQFECEPEEIAERLEEAYQAKKDGSIKAKQEAARKFALEYDETEIFAQLWRPTLKLIEKQIHEPKNLEGVQSWRRMFVPQNINPAKVIDIGAGKTQPYRKILESLGEYVGVDNRGGKDNVTADACSLPFQDGEFGFAWMSEVLEHLEDPQKALDEAKRVAVHGVCIFNTPQNASFHMDPGHKVVNLEYTKLASGDGLISW